MSIPRSHHTTALDRNIPYQNYLDEFDEIYQKLNAALSINHILAQRVQHMQNEANSLIFKVVREVLKGADPNALWRLHYELRTMSLDYRTVDTHFKALKSPSPSESHLGLNHLQTKLSWVKSTLDHFLI